MRKIKAMALGAILSPAVAMTVVVAAEARSSWG